MSERRHWGRAYQAPGITVYYDARRCAHVAECVRGLPGVFNTQVRPWIKADQAPPEEVAEVVRRCPTGALHYVLADGPEEPAEAVTVVTPLPDGPLAIRGEIRLQVGDGEFRETRATFCRCGHSANKPFCDGSHARVGWRSELPAEAAGES